jgi:HlyD family secretion protein
MHGPQHTEPMNTMNATGEDSLARLQIAPEKKRRRQSGPAISAGIVVLVVAGLLLAFLLTRDNERVPRASNPAVQPATAALPAKAPGDVVLTASGYIVPRERIEISPKFMGTVKTITVKKGDRVRRGDVLVQLEDDEYRARLMEAEGRLALAEANLRNAELNLARQRQLAEKDVDSVRALDEAQRARDAAAAELKIAQGQLALARTYLEWCTIRAPIDGVILEKLVDPNELVAPQSFGGSRGPSTAFVAMADLNDLQVEIDLNEADTPKVRLHQRCRISPEAYPEKLYTGHVAEIAPEASRQKGTLQVKVQIENPDGFLTPELTAKVDFLAD